MTKRYWFLVCAIVLLTLARIATTYLTFAQIMDEPVHITAGHEWLTQGHYYLDFEHPPLPRAIFALPFIHDRATHIDDNLEYGNDLLALHDRYIHNLASARRGNLLFVAIAAFALAACARRLFDEKTAIVALLLFVMLPVILAHGGLATTDMAGVAGFALALWALLVWIDDPSRWHSTLLGVTIAFGVCCKYSFPIFFPAAALIVLIARRRFAPAKLLAAIAIACVVTWGAFGFRFTTMADVNPHAVERARAAHVPESWTHIRVPAPDLLLGFLTVRAHNIAGHPAFLLGQAGSTGWWYYFPIALAVKTPIPFLLLALAGMRRKHWFLIAMAAVILAISMCSRINIGVRHIAVIYIPLSILAAYACVELWRSKRAIVAVAMLWLIASSALAHPDYLPWMNAFAGPRPYHVLLDSNFEWGQDIWRLARICRKRGITYLGYAVVTSIRPTSIGITGGELLREDTPARGWLVLSEQNRELARAKNPHAFEWLDRYPFERVGKTLRLYHVGG